MQQLHHTTYYGQNSGITSSVLILYNVVLFTTRSSCNRPVFLSLFRVHTYPLLSRW